MTRLASWVGRVLTLQAARPGSWPQPDHFDRSTGFIFTLFVYPNSAFNYIFILGSIRYLPILTSNIFLSFFNTGTY